MSRERTRPSAVILDLLRSSRGRQRSARSLIAAGALFGFAENTMRVTLSRLLARGLIESPERGRYRLAGHTDALHEFVERWRLGEARVRLFQGGWWLVHCEGGPPDEASAWVLDALGFRRIRDGLLARPDNLAQAPEAFMDQARALGLSEQPCWLLGRPASVAAEDWWSRWQPGTLDADYADACARLERSAQRLASLEPDAARLECFTLGGEMIHRLAKDPLLPDGVVDAGLRERLWRLMLEYDEQGQAIWSRHAGGDLRRMPRPALARSA